jgi:putative transcriptional regulator
VPFERSTKGRLLVATPPLDDPNFDRSVVFMIEHDADGALGVVLNRFDDFGPGLDVLALGIDTMDSWLPLLAQPARLHAGGPVGDDSLIALASSSSATAPGWALIGGTVGTVDLTSRPGDMGAMFDQVRVFRGYSGWAAGQLEAELDDGAWMVFDALVEDVFCADPVGLWRRVLRRQGGQVAWLANAPDDLSAN